MRWHIFILLLCETVDEVNFVSLLTKKNILRSTFIKLSHNYNTQISQLFSNFLYHWQDMHWCIFIMDGNGSGKDRVRYLPARYHTWAFWSYLHPQNMSGKKLYPYLSGMGYPSGTLQNMFSPWYCQNNRINMFIKRSRAWIWNPYCHLSNDQ